MKNTNWFLTKEALLKSENVSKHDKAFIKEGFYTPDNEEVNKILKEHSKFLNFSFEEFKELLEYGDTYLYNRSEKKLVDHSLFYGEESDSLSRLHLEQLFTLLYKSWWCKDSSRWEEFAQGVEGLRVSDRILIPPMLKKERKM